MLDARNVTVIVVTYNRLPLLKQCLAALRAQTVQGFTVLLVDNASTDGTADYIKTLAMPGLVCRNPGENLGGAGGFAYGIRAAVESMFYFAAMLAVNLAVMNLLPIPALDGGHILFLVVDAVSMLLLRKKVPARYMAAVNTAGFVVLMGFMLFVTFHDVFRLVG